jgi:hypothetical protein
MDVVSFERSAFVLAHRMIGRVPFPNRRSFVIGVIIAFDPENDRHRSPWQEAVGPLSETLQLPLPD